MNENEFIELIENYVDACNTLKDITRSTPQKPKQPNFYASIEQFNEYRQAVIEHDIALQEHSKISDKAYWEKKRLATEINKLIPLQRYIKAGKYAVYVTYAYDRERDFPTVELWPENNDVTLLKYYHKGDDDDE